MNRFLALSSLLLVLAMAACSTGRQVQALKAVSKSAGEAALEKDYLLVEAMKYHVAGDASSALELVNQAVKRDSLCAACYYLQSDIYGGAGKYTLAVEAADRARAIDSTNEWYAIMQATLNMRKGNLEQSIKQFEEVLTMKGYNAGVHYNLANLYLASGNTDQAMAMLDTLESHEGYDDRISLLRQQVYYRLGYSDKSLEEAKKLNDFAPNTPQYVVLLGDAYAREGDIVEAKKYYEQALAIDSLYPPAQLGMLDAYQRMEKHEDFFAGLRKVCQNKRLSLEEKGQYLTLVVQDRTLGTLGAPWLSDIFEEMFLAYPGDWNLTLLYVSYLTQANRFDRAIEVYEGYMAQPAYKDSYERQEIYLSLLSGGEKWDKLITKSDTALKTNSKNIAFYIFKNIGLWQLNRLDEAAKTLKTALKHASDTTQQYDLHARLGDIYHQNGEKKKAFNSYEKALKINPEGIIVLNNYAYYLSEEGERLTDALKMAKKVIDVEPNNPTYLDTYGWILYKMGLHSEAKNVFRQAILYGGRTESVLLDHYGDVLLALKEYDTAILYYEYALDAADCENPDKIKAKIEKAKALR